MNMTTEQDDQNIGTLRQDAVEGFAKAIKRLGWDLRFSEPAEALSEKLVRAMEQVGEEEDAASEGEPN
jgi:ABC-type hemin transport system substrate-binding protein